MVEIRNANRPNHFSHLFPSSTSPNFIYSACCMERHLFSLPYFTQYSLPLERLGSCGASLSLLLAVSPREAVSSCIPHRLWPRKPPRHKLLETWESILGKRHCICAIILFLRHPVWLLVDIRYRPSWLSCCACSFVHPDFKLYEKLLVYFDIAYSNEQWGRPPWPPRYSPVYVHEIGHTFFRLVAQDLYCALPEGLKKGQQQQP